MHWCPWQVDMAAMHVQASIRGICCSPVPPSTSCMAVQPGTGCLVLTSPSASLQFFDPLRCGLAVL